LAPLRLDPLPLLTDCRRQTPAHSAAPHNSLPSTPPLNQKPCVQHALLSPRRLAPPFAARGGRILEVRCCCPQGEGSPGAFSAQNSSFTSPLNPGSIRPSPLPARGKAGKGGGEIPGVIGISLFGAVVLPALRGGNGFSYRCLCFLS